MTAVRPVFVRTPGPRIHALVAGAAEPGPPVVMLHGFPQTSHCFWHQLTAMAAAGHRAYAMDTRGFGRTEKPGTRVSRALLAADVVAFCRQLGLSDVTRGRADPRAGAAPRRVTRRPGSDLRRRARPGPHRGAVPSGDHRTGRRVRDHGLGHRRPARHRRPRHLDRHRRERPAGVRFVDAPVSVRRSDPPTFLAFLGTEEPPGPALRTVLGTYCHEVVEAGPVGASQAVKIEPARMRELAARGSGNSHALTTWSTRASLYTEPGDPRRRALAHKDLAAALDLAERTGVALPVTAAALGELRG